MTPEELKLDIDKRRLILEESKFEYSKAQDERHEKTERLGKVWMQLSTVIPIVAIIVGFYMNVRLENVKRENVAYAESRATQRAFVDKQLSDFYYPIHLRLQKDTAVWTLAKQLHKDGVDYDAEKFSKFIESNILVPNHKEIIAIIDKNFMLLKNPYEKLDVGPLVKVIGSYERHVSAYVALRGLDTFTANPIQICEDCNFPNEFPLLITARIAELEKQRSLLDAPSK